MRFDTKSALGLAMYFFFQGLEMLAVFERCIRAHDPDWRDCTLVLVSIDLFLA